MRTTVDSTPGSLRPAALAELYDTVLTDSIGGVDSQEGDLGDYRLPAN
ncbi:MAG: hypothetical protein AAGJ40_20860 [Planctomycetota bacterium]